MRPNRSFDTDAQRQAFASFRPLSAGRRSTPTLGVKAHLSKPCTREKQ
jgi:hypothetical protein